MKSRGGYRNWDMGVAGWLRRKWHAVPFAIGVLPVVYRLDQSHPPT